MTAPSGPAPAVASDLVGPAAERHEEASDTLRAAFRRHGYQPVMPPVLERAEHFLDRTGEDIRSRMYLFTDPGGREVCLRPELTIPTVRLYTDSFGDGRLFRGYYVGPVFRYDHRGGDRYRQFTQAGVELIGEPDTARADAEVVATAHDALTACGLSDLRVSVSDISFYTGLIEAEGPALSAKLASRLRALSTAPARLAAFLDRTPGHRPPEGADTGSGSGAANGNGAAGAAGGGLDFLASLNGVAPEERRELVAGIVRSLQGSEPFGSRTIEDITERALAIADAADHNGLPARLERALRQLLAIRRPLGSGLAEVEALARASQATGLSEVLDRWSRKVELFASLGLDPGTITLDLRLGRGIDYYSSFVFEINDGRADGSGAAGAQLCAGGRYDDLVQYLGATNPVPAVGFAIGVEPVLAATATASPGAGGRP
jgi:ATP phosphoribosyltransferase regulatory subunit